MDIVNQRGISLLHLPYNKKAIIVGIQGGYGIQKKLRVMGIREGQEIKIVSRQPFQGPLTIKIRNSQMTLGKGMAQKILVEVI